MLFKLLSSQIEVKNLIKVSRCLCKHTHRHTQYQSNPQQTTMFLSLAMHILCPCAVWNSTKFPGGEQKEERGKLREITTVVKSPVDIVLPNAFVVPRTSTTSFTCTTPACHRVQICLPYLRMTSVVVASSAATTEAIQICTCTVVTATVYMCDPGKL